MEPRLGVRGRTRLGDRPPRLPGTALSGTYLGFGLPAEAIGAATDWVGSAAAYGSLTTIITLGCAALRRAVPPVRQYSDTGKTVS